MRFGPPPRIMTFLRCRSARASSLVLVGRVVGTACSASNSAAQVSTRLKTGRMPCLRRAWRTCSSLVPAQLHQAPVGEAVLLAPQQRRASSSTAAPRFAPSMRTASSASTICAQVAQEPRVDLGELERLDLAEARRAAPRPSCHRRSGLGAHDLRACSSSSGGALSQVEARSGRSPASAAPSAGSP